MAGIAEEETMEEMDKGPVAYQESKVFNSEPTLITVYDNVKQRHCTFETYSLDTQAQYFIKYDYQVFDNLFRFNAELMNPNRKEQRFHWVIQRLEISQIGTEVKLRLGPEPTEDVPQLPLYEEKRKIPTGRMDLKQRQRLRESMDMLDVQRDENIQRKRAAAREKFLAHIFHLKEEAKRKKKEVEEKIAQEVAERYKYIELMEIKEEEERIRNQEKLKIRRKAVQVVEQRTEAAEEEELTKLRERWKAKDREKAMIIAEAQAKLEKDAALRAEAEVKQQKHLAEIQSKRELNWKLRDDRIKLKRTEWLQKQFDKKAERRRAQRLAEARNEEYRKDLHEERQPWFRGCILRTRDREESRVSEAEATQVYLEKRALPEKKPARGRNAPKDPAAKSKPTPKAKSGSKKSGSKKSDSKSGGDKSDKSDTESKDDIKSAVDQVIDAVEMKMRAEMEMQRERAKKDVKRAQGMEERAAERQAAAVAHMKEYRDKYEKELVEKEKQAEERKIVRREREEERRAAEERKAQELQRLLKVREQNVARIEQKRLEALMA